MTLPDRIRAAAKAQDLGIEKFRAKHDLPNTAFYLLLRGEPPRVTSKHCVLLDLLKSAGVRVVKSDYAVSASEDALRDAS